MKKCWRKGCENPAAENWMYCSLACQEIDRLEIKKKEERYEDSVAPEAERVSGPAG